LLDALIQLQKKIRKESLKDRMARIEQHRTRVKLGPAEVLLPNEDFPDYMRWGVQTEAYELDNLELVRGNIRYRHEQRERKRQAAASA
jgi:hypothetical protein